MNINLSSEKNILKFYKRLWFYKSFWFKFVKFKCNDSISLENENIISALNIKNRRKRITFIYDECCRILDKSNVNVCGFVNDKCYIQQIKNNGRVNGCCGDCIYKAELGCSTSNVACKLFNCSEVKKRCEIVTFNDLHIARLLNLRQRMILKSDFFSLREDVISDLCSYSAVYSSIKILLRLIRNKYFRKSVKKL